MALLPAQQIIAKILNYDPVSEEEGLTQYHVEPNCSLETPGGNKAGDIYKTKQGVLRYYWVPKGDNHTKEEKRDLEGWYDIPNLEDIEEWVFDSVCFTPADDEVEPDHPDSWLTLLGLI
ncbi:hypothetical protein EB001_17495 [bacterium]|nr:hypothetical protein [bacterium]